MASPKEKLDASLEALKAPQKGGWPAIRSADLGRAHRERLLQPGLWVHPKLGLGRTVAPKPPLRSPVGDESDATKKGRKAARQTGFRAEGAGGFDVT